MGIVLLWLHIVTGIVSLTLSWLLWWQPAAPGRTAVALLMLAVAVWSAAYGAELASADAASIRFWLHIEYLGIATAPVCWFAFAVQYSGHGSWLTPHRLAALGAIPATTILLNLTNRWHHWYYAAITVDRSGPLPLAALRPGPWYWVHMAYAMALMVLGTVALARMWQHTARLYHPHMWVLVAGVCLPLGVNLAYLAGLRPFGHLDLTPLAITVTGGLIYWGVFRFHLFSVVPIARNVLFEQLHDAVLVLDQHDRVVDLNRGAEGVLGLSLAAAVGRPRAEILAPWPALARVDARAPVCQVELPGAQRAVFEVRLIELAGRRGDGGAMLVLHDITAQKALEAERELLIDQLNTLATTDGLTGLLNRRSFLERAEAAWERAASARTPVAVLLLDLDHFKAINDCYGHLVGDRVLRAVGQCCQQLLAEPDLVGRYGGEEFAVILEPESAESVLATAEQLRARIAALVIPGCGAGLRVTASIGVALGLPPLDTLTETIHQADLALYAAKEHGRDQVQSADSAGGFTLAAVGAWRIGRW